LGFNKQGVQHDNLKSGNRYIVYLSINCLVFKIDYCINSSGLVEGAKDAVKSGMGNYLDF
jgi:hypothetical protein